MCGITTLSMPLTFPPETDLSKADKGDALVKLTKDIKTLFNINGVPVTCDGKSCKNKKKV